MSGGEPSSIKQCSICAAVSRSQSPVENRGRNFFVPFSIQRPDSVLSLRCGGGDRGMPFPLFLSGKESVSVVSGAVPQMAAQDLRRGDGPVPHHRNPQKPRWPRGGCPMPTCSPAPGAPARPPAPRSWPGRQLRAPGGRQPCNEVPACRGILTAPFWMSGTGRRLQQRRGPDAGPAG